MACRCILWRPLDKQSLYSRLIFPQQSVAFYERRRGTQGPAFAINYRKREPEERDEGRRGLIGINLHGVSEGRYVLDTDAEINTQDLERLRAISDYLKPTIRMWSKIARVNTLGLRNAHGSGTLDSLLVPTTQSPSE